MHMKSVQEIENRMCDTDNRTPRYLIDWKEMEPELIGFQIDVLGICISASHDFIITLNGL